MNVFFSVNITKEGFMVFTSCLKALFKGDDPNHFHEKNSGFFRKLIRLVITLNHPLLVGNGAPMGWEVVCRFS